MPKLDKRLTDGLARTLRGPESEGELKSTFVVHWCGNTPGFGLRVTRNGDRAFISERRVDGKTVRRTLGKAAGPGTISADTARKLMLTVSSELQTGVDRVEVKREARKVEKREGLTFASALDDYVTRKKKKNGIGLKPRTKADYLGMVKPGAPLAVLAKKSIYKIDAEAIRAAHAAIKSTRQAVYAMQVARAVMAWHGVTIENSPFAASTAGAQRIAMSTPRGKPTPIPVEKLAAWWKAATARAGDPAADGLRLMLVTGARPGEIFGSKHAIGLQVGDVQAHRMTLRDTKNSADHEVLLSTQACAILEPHLNGKGKVFKIMDTRDRLRRINTEAGVVGITAHKLRHTFASTAARLCNAFELKAMMNHSTKGDVTAEHYVGVGEAELRKAWQKVADAITTQKGAPR